MKFRNKLFIIGSIFATSTIAFVTSCSNNETKITNKNKENVESFEIVSYVEHNSNSSIFSVTINKANIIKKDNDTYWLWTKGITSDSTAQDKFNKVKKTVVEKINNYIQEKYLSNIKLPNKKENNLFVNINEISGMPKEIYVKINNKKIKLLLSNITKDIEYGKLGEKNQNKEMQNLAQSIENIPVKYTFSYMPSYNSYNVSGLDNINIIKVENVNINPTLKNLTINSNSDNFKPTGISFEDSSISGSAFKAKIQSVSDGDTFSVVSLENKTLKGGIQIIKDEVYKIRLSGIDTPEKGIGDGNKYISASPFEYSFALHATNFANQVINNDKYKNNVMVGFVSGKDTFNRVTADIFFGENYQFSYNAEIVRSGHTLPYSNDIWKLKFTEKDKNSYEYNLYPFISEAFEEAIKNKKGMFNYFSHPEDASLFVYKIKNNNKWHPFYWEKTNKDDIVKDYIKN